MGPGIHSDLGLRGDEAADEASGVEAAAVDADVDLEAVGLGGHALLEDAEGGDVLGHDGVVHLPEEVTDFAVIGGVVAGAGGGEAGVWVIAETRTLPTRFIRSVVTDDQVRFVIPDLP